MENIRTNEVTYKMSEKKPVKFFAGSTNKSKNNVCQINIRMWTDILRNLLKMTKIPTKNF